MSTTPEKMTYIDCDELAVRIGEACMSNKRPPGVTPQEAMKQLEEMSPDAARGFQRAAFAAANYIAECCNLTYPGSVEVKKVVVESDGVQ